MVEKCRWDLRLCSRGQSISSLGLTLWVLLLPQHPRHQPLNFTPTNSTSRPRRRRYLRATLASAVSISPRIDRCTQKRSAISPHRRSLDNTIRATDTCARDNPSPNTSSLHFTFFDTFYITTFSVFFSLSYLPSHLLSTTPNTR